MSLEDECLSTTSHEDITTHCASELLIMSDKEFFSTIPLVRDLLQQPSNIQFTPTCRLEGPESTLSKTQDQFFRRGLKDKTLVPYATAFYEDSFTTASPPTRVEQTSVGQELRLLIRKSTLVFSLQPGTNGFNGTAHGGLITTLIDEAMGSLILINHKIHSELPASTRENLSGQVLDMRGLAMFTASMDVRFRTPLPTPSIVLVEAIAERIKGRKLFISVTVKGMNNVIHATCDGMWMSIGSQEKL
ncbi:HotDog domain-containing protein [Paraphoma chrysanthemicola]|nr:HotDog domain-containing protein [Paraphoma chrysanthemicola]